MKQLPESEFALPRCLFVEVLQIVVRFAKISERSKAFAMQTYQIIQYCVELRIVHVFHAWAFSSRCITFPHLNCLSLSLKYPTGWESSFLIVGRTVLSRTWEFSERQRRLRPAPHSKPWYEDLSM